MSRREGLPADPADAPRGVPIPSGWSGSVAEIDPAATSIAHAPWTVVPADRKWYARCAVQQLLKDALERIGPTWPVADFDVDEQIQRLRATLG